jgi:hypothetical protein
MKKFLFLSLIYLSFCVDWDTIRGPAYNSKHYDSEYSCQDRYVKWGTTADGTSAIWRDDENINGVSDCVDSQLWSTAKNKYFDRCCYIRFLLDGNMHSGCIGLSEENYLDTTETIRRMEKGDRDIWTRYGANSKVYQLDCFSSYIKGLTATILLFALFF